MKLVKVRPTDKSVNEFRFDDAFIGMIVIVIGIKPHIIH